MSEEQLTFQDLIGIEDDLKRNTLTYEIFDEDQRLQSRVGRIEYQTTMTTIQSYLKPDMRILDVGAGTGAYSIPLAEQGYTVVAYEPAERNYAVFCQKIADALWRERLDLHQASSYDLHELQSESFDIVLLFGPLYHLSSVSDQMDVLSEAKRLIKAGGVIMVSFINHDMIAVTESVYDPAWFDGDSYDHQTLRIQDHPFIFLKIDECRSRLLDAGLRISREIASDGFSEMMGKQLNQMSETAYQQFCRWHASMCEKPEMLSATNHFLFVCEV